MPRDEVLIPGDAVVTFTCVRIPIETPVGVVDGTTMQVSFMGKRYQALGLEDDGEFHVIDMDTGEICKLRCVRS